MAMVDDNGTHRFFIDGVQVHSAGGYSLWCQDSVFYEADVNCDYSLRECAFYDDAVYTGTFTIGDTQARWNASML